MLTHSLTASASITGIISKVCFLAHHLCVLVQVIYVDNHKALIWHNELW